jgi:hypothetical protein
MVRVYPYTSKALLRSRHLVFETFHFLDWVRLLPSPSLHPRLTFSSTSANSLHSIVLSTQNHLTSKTHFTSYFPPAPALSAQLIPNLVLPPLTLCPPPNNTHSPLFRPLPHSLSRSPFRFTSSNKIIIFLLLPPPSCDKPDGTGARTDGEREKLCRAGG